MSPGSDPHPGLALTSEKQPWEPKRAPIAGDRRATPSTYAASVPAHIADMRFDLDDDILATAEDARASIVRFDAELSLLLGADNEFAPMSSVLLRTEAASSSQIENITSGARALALAELGIARFGSNARQVVANVDAMQRAIALAEDVTSESILAIHEALMRDQPRIGPGEFRDEPVWIGGGDSSPHGASYVAPHHTRVSEGIEDLCQFTRRTNISLIAHAAITHAQFETIHPFVDGNGRTGRAIVHAMLKRGHATTRTTVPISAGLLSNTGTYYDALTAYRLGDPNPIVARFNDATYAAIANGSTLAADLSTIHQDWQNNLTARRDAVAWRVLPLLLAQPAVTSKVVEDRCNVSQPAAGRALNQLLEAGIVQRKNEHGEEQRRNVVWRSDDVLAALDEFGERARRRTG
jgi:Fic family protein